MAIPFPLSVELLIKRLQCLPPNMRIKVSQGDKEYYVENLLIESDDVVTIKMIPLENFTDPCNIESVENEFNNENQEN